MKFVLNVYFRGNNGEWLIRLSSDHKLIRSFSEFLWNLKMDIALVENGVRHIYLMNLTCCWFSRWVLKRASIHCRVSMNAFRCAFSRGQCVKTPAQFVHINAMVVLPI